MSDPITLSVLAGQFLSGAASAIGAEIAKDVYSSTKRGLFIKPHDFDSDERELVDLYRRQCESRYKVLHLR